MERGSCVPQGTEIVQTGFHYTLSLIGGKYKMAILYLLAEHGVLRHNAIHRRIAGIRCGAEGTRSGWACRADGVPAGTAQGGVCPHGARAVAHPDPTQHV